MNLLSALFPLPAGHPQRWLVGAWAVVCVLCLWAAVDTGYFWLAGIPAGLLVAWLAVVDFGRVYFLMLGCIPISTEVELPGGLSTDLPSEPLMWLLTVVTVLWFPLHWRKVDARYLKHPITLALLLHLAWMTVCVVTSTNVVVSFKFLLAKGWYVLVFYFLSLRLLQELPDFKRLVWWFFVPLLVAVLSVLVRHAPYGFSFKEVNFVMGPFFRNHVMYACLLAIFLPFAWYATYWYRKYSGSWWLLVVGIAIFLMGINFAYTRGAYVALLAAIGIYWMIRRQVVKIGLLVFTLLFAGLIAFLTRGDNWLEFAPNYERAVTHTRFESLLEATYKLEDISTMERVYRWVASSYMIRDRPFTGFGPGNFYFNYQKYTVSSFKTYVSDNPEHSGIHNYFLMTTVEQGVPGLVFFVIFCLAVIFKGQQVYHRTQVVYRRRMLVAALLSFMLIAMLMLMNDFVETDKIGSLFFICAALVVNTDLKKEY